MDTESQELKSKVHQYMIDALRQITRLEGLVNTEYSHIVTDIKNSLNQAIKAFDNEPTEKKYYAEIWGDLPVFEVKWQPDYQKFSIRFYSKDDIEANLIAELNAEKLLRDSNEPINNEIGDPNYCWSIEDYNPALHDSKFDHLELNGRFPVYVNDL